MENEEKCDQCHEMNSVMTIIFVAIHIFAKNHDFISSKLKGEKCYYQIKIK